ncbi:hypothetical protein BRADI_4g01703v3 [Brachypodium distachyon]|uniref:Uncharacterized protein n=1 Tax=Brachypodium distachyon TaxID=15368 RepID=A0A0Q3EHL0_BRADI|nr:hypothetical protein BRADI_4g01703v3 [Brachypodium distachyon]
MGEGTMGIIDISCSLSQPAHMNSKEKNMVSTEQDLRRGRYFGIKSGRSRRANMQGNSKEIKEETTDLAFGRREIKSSIARSAGRRLFRRGSEEEIEPLQPKPTDPVMTAMARKLLRWIHQSPKSSGSDPEQAPKATTVIYIAKRRTGPTSPPFLSRRQSHRRGGGEEAG